MVTPRPDKLAQARALLASGDVERARGVLLRLVRERPRESAAAALLALVLERSGDAAGATFYAGRAHQASPGDPALAYGHGRALAQSGQFEEAARVFERAIALAPRAAEPRVALGLAL